VSVVVNIIHNSIDLVLIKLTRVWSKGLYIVEERHETVVHVQLLVTVEKRQPWIISNKVHLGFLVAAQHHNIF
jgi:hypothetical protein